MHNSRSLGFTLIEILVVVGLLTISAIYFTQLFIENSEEKIAVREVADLMTIRAAAVGYLQKYNEWKNEELTEPCDDMITGLMDVKYLGGVSSGNLTSLESSCEVVDGRHPLLILERTALGNEDIAKMVAFMLPSAVAEGTKITMYVPRPREGFDSSLFSISDKDGGVVGNNGTLNVPYLDNCESEDQKIIAYPNIVCSESSTLGGFKVEIEEHNAQDHWHVELHARSDASFNYDKISTCKTGNSNYTSVSFSYVTVCDE